MATTSVLFQFHWAYGNSTKPVLEARHQISTSAVLQKPEGQLPQDPDAFYLFQLTAGPMIFSHTMELVQAAARSNITCVLCAQPSTTITCALAPGWDNASNLFVKIDVFTLCPKEECKHGFTKRVQATIDTGEDLDIQRASIAKHCPICFANEGLKFCQRCKVTAYCGKEHQKEDWKEHKKSCEKWAKAKEAFWLLRNSGYCSRVFRHEKCGRVVDIAGLEGGNVHQWLMVFMGSGRRV